MSTSRQGRALSRLVIIAMAMVPLVWGEALVDTARLNPRLHLSASSLSPPGVHWPIHECARKVFIFGLVPGASAQVYAGGGEVIGRQNENHFGFAVIPLNRELKLGERVSATQTVGGFTSVQTYDPVVVMAHDPNESAAPVVGPEVYDCGQVVVVDQVVANSSVSVFSNQKPVGRDEAVRPSVAVVTAPLKLGQSITVQQVVCPDQPAKRRTGSMSAPQTVQAAPDPPPAPSVDPTVPGNDSVTVRGLLVGAEVEIRDHGTLLASGCLATGPDMWVPVDRPISMNPSLQARQKLCTWSALSLPQTQTIALFAPIILPPVCDGAREVTIRGTQINATVVLFCNGVSIGYGGAVPGDLVLQVGGGRRLKTGDVLNAFQYVGKLVSPWSDPVVVGDCCDMVTYHNDQARTGVNAKETILTLANVRRRTFGKLFSHDVDGFVYAQPLYLSRVAIPNRGTHNLVFIATEHDSVYAFDADSTTGPNASWLWHVSFINPPAGITTVPTNPEHQGLNDVGKGCEDVMPEIGITGTPVIERETGTLYVVAKTKEVKNGHNHYVQRLHALEISTGAEKLGGPVVIAETICDNPQSVSGPYQYVSGPKVAGIGESNDGAGHVYFNALRQAQRPALALVGGVVYVTWASHCDIGPYHGWVLGFDAKTLRLVSVLNVTPNAKSGDHGLAGGGIWQSGAAPAADDQGALYLATGNGVFDEELQSNGFPKLGNFGDSILKLMVDSNSSPTHPNQNGWGLKVADYFAPHDQATLEEQDTDLGAGGVLVLPEQKAQPGRLIVQAGKAGIIYLLDRDHLGKFQAKSDDQIVQALRGAIGGAWSMPAYFEDRIYYHGANDVMKSFRVVRGRLSPNPVAQATPRSGFPGATPSISGGPGNGLVWELQTDKVNDGPPVLRAYRADDLEEIYNSTMSGNRDVPPGTAVKFSLPTVVNGKVYVGTSTSVAVYGNLWQPQSQLIRPPPSATSLHKSQ